MFVFVHQFSFITNIELFVISGPAVGSFLYAYGGFKFPFIVVGSLGILISGGLYFAIPDLQEVTE